MSALFKCFLHCKICIWEVLQVQGSILQTPTKTHTRMGFSAFFFFQCGTDPYREGSKRFMWEMLSLYFVISNNHDSLQNKALLLAFVVNNKYKHSHQLRWHSAACHFQEFPICVILFSISQQGPCIPSTFNQDFRAIMNLYVPCLTIFIFIFLNF